MTQLPTCRPRQIESSASGPGWLVESLWLDQAVGVLGGEPKCCKSFLALELAVSVASGAPCLRQFPPHVTGPVLLYAAEDALPVVRQRLLRHRRGCRRLLRYARHPRHHRSGAPPRPTVRL